MSPKQADELMDKRKFMLISKSGEGIRWYYPKDIGKTPYIGVLVIPERNEFKCIYKNKNSDNVISTPWYSSLDNKEELKKALLSMRKWAHAIEDMYKEESECMQQ